MEILYSRYIGVLNAKVKYILPQDHDGFFFAMEFFYEEAEKTNFDMVSFMDIEIKDLYGNIKRMREG